jgi:hypothetical protein
MRSNNRQAPNAAITMRLCQIQHYTKAQHTKSTVFGVTPREARRDRSCLATIRMPRLPLSFKPKELLAVLLPVWSPPKARPTSPIKRRSDNTHLPVTNCGERKPPLAVKRSDHCSSGIEPRRCSYKVRHMSSMKIGGVSLTGISSDPRHPASLPKRLAALFALVIVVCRSEGVLVVKFITDRECHQFCARLRICDEVRGDILTGSQAS